MKNAVLDASAVLAVLRREDGADSVRRYLPGGMISCVNLAEVYYKLIYHGESLEFARFAVGSLQLHVIPFDEEQAAVYASLHRSTLKHSLSYADRACLSLGLLPTCFGCCLERMWSRLLVASGCRKVPLVVAL